jgi:hypothetical protein
MFGRSVVIALAVCTLAGCGEAYRYFKSGPVSWSLKQEVRDRGASRVVLSQLTNFGWDQLFLFEPYTPKTEVCATLAIAASECDREVQASSTDDGEMLLAFRQAGAVVHVELHYRWHGDFTPLVAEQPVGRNKAIFRVLREGDGASGGPWLKLVLE